MAASAIMRRTSSIGRRSCRIKPRVGRAIDLKQEPDRAIFIV